MPRQELANISAVQSINLKMRCASFLIDKILQLNVTKTCNSPDVQIRQLFHIYDAWILMVLMDYLITYHRSDQTLQFVRNFQKSHGELSYLHKLRHESKFVIDFLNTCNNQLVGQSSLCKHCTTCCWKMWRAFPGPENGFTRTNSFNWGSGANNWISERTHETFVLSTDNYIQYRQKYKTRQVLNTITE